MDKNVLLQDILKTLPTAEILVLEKIAAILRLEGKRTLRDILEEISIQHSDWCFDDETTRNAVYWNPTQFAAYYSEFLDYPAQLSYNPIGRSRMPKEKRPGIVGYLKFHNKERCILQLLAKEQ